MLRYSPDNPKIFPTLAEAGTFLSLKLQNFGLLEKVVQHAGDNPTHVDNIADQIRKHAEPLLLKDGGKFLYRMKQVIKDHEIYHHALTDAIKETLPEILNRKDYKNFLGIMRETRKDPILHSAFTDEITALAGQQMLDEGHPADFLNLKKHVDFNSNAGQKLHALESGYNIVDYPAGKHPRLTIMLERTDNPNPASAICQCGSIAGRTPSELVIAWEKAHGPTIATDLQRQIIESLQFKAEAKNAIPGNEIGEDGKPKDKFVPTPDSYAAKMALKELDTIRLG